MVSIYYRSPSTWSLFFFSNKKTFHSYIYINISTVHNYQDIPSYLVDVRGFCIIFCFQDHVQCLACWIRSLLQIKGVLINNFASWHSCMTLNLVNISGSKHLIKHIDFDVHFWVHVMYIAPTVRSTNSNFRINSSCSH